MGTTVSTPEWDDSEQDDSQMNIMGNLALLRHLSTLTTFPSMRPSEIQDNVLIRILSWIATSFVREAQGDAVAAALTVSSREFRFYLTSNRGKPEPQDMENSNNFIAVLRDAMCTYQSPDDKVGLSTFKLVLGHAISTSTARLARKLEAIVTTVNEGPQTSDSEKEVVTFEDLVKKWSVLPDTPKEDSTLAGFFEHTYGTGTSTGLVPSDMLLKLFERLIKRCQQGSQEGFDVVSQRRACILAEMVTRSQFFKSLSPSCLTAPFKIKELYWLLKLKRRIWRIANYPAGARLLVITGLDFFGRVLGTRLDDFLAGGPGISIEWVWDYPDNLPSPHAPLHHWPSSAKDRLEQILSANYFERKVSLPTDGDFLAALGQVFQEGDSVIPRLHCEARLIHYLQTNDIRVRNMAVGVSKSACFACEAYVSAINETIVSKPWKLPGCSGKFHHAWLIPPNNGGGVVRGVVRVVGHKLIEVLQQLVNAGVFGEDDVRITLGMMFGPESGE